MKYYLAIGAFVALTALGGQPLVSAQDRRLLRNPADPQAEEPVSPSHGELFSKQDTLKSESIALGPDGRALKEQQSSILLNSCANEDGFIGTCNDLDASCVVSGQEKSCFENGDKVPDEEALIRASGGQDLLDPDNKATWPRLVIDDDAGSHKEEPDESIVWESPLGACAEGPAKSRSDAMDSPDFDEPMFGYVPDEEDKFIEEDGRGGNPPEENGRGGNPPKDDKDKEKETDLSTGGNPFEERPDGRHLELVNTEADIASGELQLQDNGHRSLQSASTTWTVGGISPTEIQFDLYLSAWGYNVIYNDPPQVRTLDLCWKKQGQSFICNKNRRSILTSEPWVTSISQYHHRVTINYSQGKSLECGTKYVFVVRTRTGWLGPLFGRKASTLACPLCAWGDSITAFTGNYVVQGSVLEYTNNACRLHRGDFNGDGKTDILRSCDNPYYNALWRGNTGSSGFTPVGYVIQTSALEKSNQGCKLHIGDFNGDNRDDLLRTCTNPYYNALWYGNASGSPFTGYGYVIQGSQLHNSNMGASALRLHIGDFNGDGKADLLRVADNSNYNAVWYGATAAFAPKGYQQQGFLLANSYRDCVLRLGNFDGDSNGTTDLFRSCENASLNRLLLGQPGNPASVFSNPFPKLTGSVMDKKNLSCRSHVGDFNGDKRDDLLRSCNDPNYNVIIYGGANPLSSGSGYINTGTVLENSSNTCRIHLGDFNGDGKTDLFRSCNSRCYNALFISQGTSTSFTGDYTLTTGLLENSALTCKVHVGNYNGADNDGTRRDDLLRTCNDNYYNALFRAFL